jgi:formate-nitrite transporter family protein
MAVTEAKVEEQEAQEQGQEQQEQEEGEKELQEEAKQRSAISAHVVYEAIRTEGNDELKRSTSALFWSAFAAGLSMGFSMVAEALIQHALPDAPWRPLVSKFGYSVGFLIVILGRQQLFTENTLTPILPLLTERTPPMLRNVLRLWGIVLLANCLGALIFALVAAYTNVFDGGLRDTFREIGLHSLGSDFPTVLLRGVFAGWLIALLVWLLPFAESARVVVIIIMTFIIGLGGFAHIIAGSVEVFYLGLTGAAPWTTVLGSFWLPALLGNIIGGVSLVAALNHAQVVAGRQGQDA